MTLTIGDLQMTLEDDRHLGHGYACCDVLSATKRARLDAAIIRVANELGLGYEELFHWSNSKHGRWLADRVYGMQEPPTAATVRTELNPDSLKNAMSFS